MVALSLDQLRSALLPRQDGAAALDINTSPFLLPDALNGDLAFLDFRLLHVCAGLILPSAIEVPIDAPSSYQYNQHRAPMTQGSATQERSHLGKSISQSARSAARRFSSLDSILPSAHTHCGLPLSPWFIARQASAHSPALNWRAIIDGSMRPGDVLLAIACSAAPPPLNKELDDDRPEQRRSGGRTIRRYR